MSKDTAASIRKLLKAAPLDATHKNSSAIVVYRSWDNLYRVGVWYDVDLPLSGWMSTLDQAIASAEAAVNRYLAARAE